jgi:hypothetical protein
MVFCCGWIIFIADIIYRRYELELSMKWEVSYTSQIASLFLILVLSVALPTTLTLLENLQYYIVCQ